MKTTEQVMVEALHVVADPIFLFEVEEGPRFRCVMVNRAGLEATGFSEEDVIGKTLAEIVPEKEAALSAERFEEVIWARKSLHSERTIDLPAGDSLTFEIATSPIFSEEGHCTHIVTLSRDASTVRATERALGEAEGRYRNLYEQAPIAYYSMNGDGFIEMCNERGAEMLGYTRDQLIGRPLHDLFTDSPSVQAKARQVIERFKAGQEIRGKELEMSTRDGRLVWARLSMTAIRDSQGKIVAGRSTAEDITELIRIEEELRASNRQLEEFASIAAHDLSEPLRKIQFFGDRLLKTAAGDLDERGQDYVTRMRQAAERMGQLVDDVLAFSRISRKGQPFQLVDLNEIARGVLSDLEVQVRESGAHIALVGLPEIEAEPTQMRQLLQNLVSNALKFRSQERPTVVTVSSAPPDDTALGMCTIIIEDNGIGFDPRSKEEIFTVFHRLHGRNQYDGTGMGLAVCRRIVERHHGTIRADSIPGEGATFLVTLPTRQSEEPSR